MSDYCAQKLSHHVSSQACVRVGKQVEPQAMGRVWGLVYEEIRARVVMLRIKAAVEEALVEEARDE